MSKQKKRKYYYEKRSELKQRGIEPDHLLAGITEFIKADINDPAIPYENFVLEWSDVLDYKSISADEEE